MSSLAAFSRRRVLQPLLANITETLRDLFVPVSNITQHEVKVDARYLRKLDVPGSPD